MNGKLQEKDVTSLVVSNCGWYSVSWVLWDRKCLLHLYRRVLLYLMLFCSGACIEDRGVFVSFFCLSVHQHVPHRYDLKLSHPRPEGGEYFLSGALVFCERFCPRMKADTGTKLVRVHHDHMILNYLYFWLKKAGETRRVLLFFCFFLCSTLQRPLSLFSYCIYWVWCWYIYIL